MRIKLQEQPFRVLLELVANSGKLVSREELRKKLWPVDTFVDFDVGLNSAIRKLRQALNDDADNPRYIETLAKRGYKFVAPVADSAAAPQPISNVSSAGFRARCPPTARNLRHPKKFSASSDDGIGSCQRRVSWPCCPTGRW